MTNQPPPHPEQQRPEDSPSEVQHDPQVLAGEDDVPRQPLDRDSAHDGYEPDAIPTQKARTALRLALVVIAAVVALVVVLALLD